MDRPNLSKSKVSPHQIYAVLDQQRRLEEMKLKICSIIERVNQTVNSLHIENLQLTNSQLEIMEEDTVKDQKPNVASNMKEEESEKLNVVVNQQLLDIELKQSFHDIEYDDDDF